MACTTCNDEKTILYFYERGGPNDPQGNSLIPCPDCTPDPLGVAEHFRQAMAMDHKELRELVDETTEKLATFVAAQPDPGLEAALRHDVVTKMLISKLVIKRDLCQCGHAMEHHQVKPDRPKGQGCDLCTECTGYQQKGTE